MRRCSCVEVCARNASGAFSDGEGGRERPSADRLSRQEGGRGRGVLRGADARIKIERNVAKPKVKIARWQRLGEVMGGEEQACPLGAQHQISCV